MFPVSDDNIFSVKNTGFSSHSGHKTAAVIVKDFGWGDFGYSGGDVATTLRF